MTDSTLDPKKARASMLQVAIALGAVYLIWGSTYLAIRFAIETIPPFLMAGARYFTAGTLLYAWSRFRGAPGRASSTGARRSSSAPCCCWPATAAWSGPSSG